MKRILSLLIIILIGLMTTLSTGCSSQNLSGKQYIRKQQKYYNYDAAMKRNKAFKGPRKTNRR